MKKTIVTGSIVAASALLATAQITINQSDILGVGKVVYQATDTLKSLTAGGLNPGPSGANKTWNFSSLLAGTVDTTTMTNPNWLAHGTSFPTSNLAGLFPDGTEYYLQNSPAGLYALGAYGDPLGTGAALIKFNPAEMLTSFPNTYGTSFLNTSVLDVKAAYATTGVDSVRYKEIKTKNILTDGWGTITTPMGTYSCIRQRGKVLTHDSVWVHLKAPINSWSFLQEAMDSAWHFAWWANNVGVAVLEFDSTEADTIRNISWLKSIPVIGGVNENAVFKGLNVYPNPSSGKFTLSAPNISGTGVAEVYSAVGEKVISVPVTNCEKHIDLGSQSPGVYFLKVVTKEGTATRKIVIGH